jgi:membrane protease YdiL (CAAX protease family)
MSSISGQVSGDPLSALSVQDSSSKRRRWFEVCLVMLLAFSGSFISAVSYFRSGSPARAQIGNSHWINATFHEIGILLLLGYILWRSARKFRDIGFQWSFKDAAIGLPVYAVSYVSYIVGATIINVIYYRFAGHYPTQIGGRQVFGHIPLIALPFHFLNPFFEELVVRAYLMTEIRELTGSVALAALVSLALQTSYHIYYGWAGMFSVGFMFIVFAGFFMIWRRAFPLVVAHGIADVLAYFQLH